MQVKASHLFPFLMSTYVRTYPKVTEKERIRVPYVWYVEFSRETNYHQPFTNVRTYEHIGVLFGRTLIIEV